MELKKAIKCIDGTYVEGDAAYLADLAYRYDSDFSDENITEIQTICISLPKLYL